MAVSGYLTIGTEYTVTKAAKGDNSGNNAGNSVFGAVYTGPGSKHYESKTGKGMTMRAMAVAHAATVLNHKNATAGQRNETITIGQPMAGTGIRERFRPNGYEVDPAKLDAIKDKFRGKNNYVDAQKASMGPATFLGQLAAHAKGQPVGEPTEQADNAEEQSPANKAEAYTSAYETMRKITDRAKAKNAEILAARQEWQKDAAFLNNCASSFYGAGCGIEKVTAARAKQQAGANNERALNREHSDIGKEYASIMDNVIPAELRAKIKADQPMPHRTH
jgi:hypothetical protein